MTDLDSRDAISRLIARQVLFKMLRMEFELEPIDISGIKLCDERLEILEKQIDDVIVNGIGDVSKELVGLINLKRGT